MNIGQALGYVFEDERWVTKLGIAGGLVLLAVVAGFTIIVPLAVGLILVGYTVAIVRNVRDGYDRPLPEWADFGALFGDGLRVSVVQFVWSLPILILYVPLAGIMVVAGGSDNGGMPGAAAILLMCGYCFVAAYGIVLAAVTPAIYALYAERGLMSDGLNASRVLGLVRDRLGDIVVILVVQVVVSLLAGLGLFLCIVGIVFTAAWATFVQAHLYGQLAARGAGSASSVGDAGPWPPVPPGPVGEPDELEPSPWDAPEEMGVADDAQDVAREVRERGEDALRSLDDTTVFVDPAPSWAAPPTEGASAPIEPPPGDAEWMPEEDRGPAAEDDEGGPPDTGGTPRQV